MHAHLFLNGFQYSNRERRLLAVDGGGGNPELGGYQSLQDLQKAFKELTDRVLKNAQSGGKEITPFLTNQGNIRTANVAHLLRFGGPAVGQYMPQSVASHIGSYVPNRTDHLAGSVLAAAGAVEPGLKRSDQTTPGAVDSAAAQKAKAVQQKTEAQIPFYNGISTPETGRMYNPIAKKASAAAAEAPRKAAAAEATIKAGAVKSAADVPPPLDAGTAKAGAQLTAKVKGKVDAETKEKGEKRKEAAEALKKGYNAVVEGGTKFMEGGMKFLGDVAEHMAKEKEKADADRKEVEAREAREKLDGTHTYFVNRTLRSSDPHTQAFASCVFADGVWKYELEGSEVIPTEELQKNTGRRGMDAYDVQMMRASAVLNGHAYVALDGKTYKETAFGRWHEEAPRSPLKRIDVEWAAQQKELQTLEKGEKTIAGFDRIIAIGKDIRYFLNQFRSPDAVPAAARSIYDAMAQRRTELQKTERTWAEELRKPLIERFENAYAKLRAASEASWKVVQTPEMQAVAKEFPSGYPRSASARTDVAAYGKALRTAYYDSSYESYLCNNGGIVDRDHPHVWALLSPERKDELAKRGKELTERYHRYRDWREITDPSEQREEWMKNINNQHEALQKIQKLLGPRPWTEAARKMLTQEQRKQMTDIMWRMTIAFRDWPSSGATEADRKEFRAAGERVGIVQIHDDYPVLRMQEYAASWHRNEINERENLVPANTVRLLLIEGKSVPYIKEGDGTDFRGWARLGSGHPGSAPERIDTAVALATFQPIAEFSPRMTYYYESVLKTLRNPAEGATINISSEVWMYLRGEWRFRGFTTVANLNALRT